jgi:DNA-binding NarL/FixJ family response regulator
MAMLMPERSVLEALALGLSKHGLPPLAGAFTSQVALLEAALRRDIDVAMVVALNDGASAVALARALRARRPGIKVAVLTMAPDAATVRAARSHAIEGVLLASSPLAEIADSIRRIAAGERIVPVQPEQHLMQNATNGTLRKLSPRQRDVLELLANGASNDEVADQLHLSVNTVKYHVRGLYRRLGVHTRAQATRALVERRDLAQL